MPDAGAGALANPSPGTGALEQQMQQSDTAARGILSQEQGEMAGPMAALQSTLGQKPPQAPELESAPKAPDSSLKPQDNKPVAIGSLRSRLNALFRSLLRRIAGRNRMALVIDP